MTNALKRPNYSFASDLTETKKARTWAVIYLEEVGIEGRSAGTKEQRDNEKEKVGVI